MNAAAERLREMTSIAWVGEPSELDEMWHEALAAAKAEGARKAVERIRSRLRIPKDGFGQFLLEVLDEEAAR